MLVNILAREGNPVAHAARLLIRQPPRGQGPAPAAAARARARQGAAHVRRRRERCATADASGRRHALTIDLQRDFALNQPLAPFALAVMDTLDPESDTYARDIVSVIEAILEDPRQVLWAQEHKARGEAVAAMKLDGIEYEERMERLEEVTWPKPLGGPARGDARRPTGRPTRGSRRTPCRRSRSSARCTSAA